MFVVVPVRVPDHVLRDCIHKAVPQLNNLRDPTKGVRNIDGPFPLLACGPYQRLHCDQYEKLWPYGIMIYGGRDRHSRYVVFCGCARNKHSTSILLIAMSGFEHMRNTLPLEVQFDGGLEPNEIKRLMWENIGVDSVYTGDCKRNTVIEAWWRILHQKVIWIYRVEMFHLQIIQLLDNLNPIHLSCIWFAYAHHVQYDLDEFGSTYNGKTIRKQSNYGHPSKKPRRVIESLFRDMSGHNHLNVVPATQQV